MTDGAEYQKKAPYPSMYRIAVKPEEVDANFCIHDANPPVCNCVHDWRIEFGNVKKKAPPR